MSLHGSKLMSLKEQIIAKNEPVIIEKKEKSKKK